MHVTITKTCLPLLAGCFLLALAGCATTKVPPPPEITQDGLVRVKDTEADLVYRRPDSKLDGYTKVALLEPTIAFRKNWKSDVNAGQQMNNRITDSDMQKMITLGKKLLMEEFTKELTKGGYTVVTEGGPDVLAISASIMELDAFVPDPNDMNGIWTEIYSDGSGEATLVLQLYDSVTGQLLVRAFDYKTNTNDGFSWRIPRNHQTNVQDARRVLGGWAAMLVKGLDKTKATAAKP